MHVQALRADARRMRDAIKAQGALGGSMSDDHFEVRVADGCRGCTSCVPDDEGGPDGRADSALELSGPCWARTSDPQLVELVLSQLS
jgi:hypothetical protein